MMNPSLVDPHYLEKILLELLNIHSPAGYTDQVVHCVGNALEQMGIAFDVTRRGAIRATIPGANKSYDRAVCVHLDTLGAMVRDLKENGRLGIAKVGNWSSRFAEGGRVTVYTENGPYRGTVLPQMASGHVYGDDIDRLPIQWDNLEIRIDEKCNTRQDLLKTGFDVGDFVAFDAMPEILPNGFINARHLDDKAGAAIVLALMKHIKSNQIALPVDCHFLFTIFEEIGSGASGVLYHDVAEMIVVDHAPVDAQQNASEFGVTIAMMDQSGPFDYHLNQKLIHLCKEHRLEHRKDIFKYYRSDSASAIESGNDTRTALVGFGVDASHGYERTHLSSLLATMQLITYYLQTQPLFERDKEEISSINGFPHQPSREVIQITT